MIYFGICHEGGGGVGEEEDPEEDLMLPRGSPNRAGFDIYASILMGDFDG